jgi:2-polyprenyl-6-methoxyphenol hydroxylase-like FAD-dependent oxidoreductase
MRRKTSPKVVVAGAGPVGLATALSLTKRGVPVELIERDDRPGTHSNALALHPGSLRMLKDWGVLSRIETEGLKVKKLVFCDVKEPRHHLDLSGIPGQEEGLLVVGQDHLEAALLSTLEASGVPVQWNHRLAGLRQTEAGVELDLETLGEGMSGYAMARLEWQVEDEFNQDTEYLVGADGHFSMVRRRSNIDFKRVAPPESFAVFEFKTDFDHGNEARVVFSEEGTSVMWPLPGGYCRWGFEIEESAAESISRDKDRLFMQIGNQGYRVLESRMLDELLSSRAPWFNGSVERFRWRMLVRFEKRLAEAFGQDRVWLAGDAGHLTGPVGMQSMNIGMKEGRKLAEALADILEGRSDSSVLDRYNNDCQREWRAILGISTTLSSRQETDPFFAMYMNRMMGCLPLCEDSLPAYAEAIGADIVGI